MSVTQYTDKLCKSGNKRSNINTKINSPFPSPNTHIIFGRHDEGILLEGLHPQHLLPRLPLHRRTRSTLLGKVHLPFCTHNTLSSQSFPFEDLLVDLLFPQLDRFRFPDARQSRRLPEQRHQLRDRDQLSGVGHRFSVRHCLRERKPEEDHGSDGRVKFGGVRNSKAFTVAVVGCTVIRMITTWMR